MNSKLPKKLQELMELIFNLNMMNKQMTEIGYDSKKLPLGKLSESILKEGYSVLKDIEEELNKKKVDKNKIYELSSQFYTLIPHSFGMRYFQF